MSIRHKERTYKLQKYSIDFAKQPPNLLIVNYLQKAFKSTGNYTLEKQANKKNATANQTFKSYHLSPVDFCIIIW